MRGHDELPEVETDLATTTDVLQELHDAYTYKVNAAVAEECWDDVDALSDAFLADSMAVMVARD